MARIKEIYALYDDKTIRVYQAYNKRIAEEALNLKTFGPSFKLERMTWIKTSFLWMMYRSGWGTKVNQEKILAIDILREGFDTLLQKAILSSYNSNIYSSYDDWKKKLASSNVRCQWDPDRDIYGNPIEKCAIQIGIKGDIVKKYINDWICNVTDISAYVHQSSIEIRKGTFDTHTLPKEDIYPIDEHIKRILGIEQN
ncbi:MAG TPA: DUF4291 domain-containing protein [Bacillota bacterium]